MDLLDLWQEKLPTGEVRFDANLTVIRTIADGDRDGWGTVFYSQAREAYKTRVKEIVRKIEPTFDLELMSRLQIAEFGSLIIAANPNSLFAGHLVIYPTKKSPVLTFENICDVTQLAETHADQTFIFNMERSAASILDWAHYQSYPIVFPIEKEKSVPLDASETIKLASIDESFPAYALIAEFSETEAATRWLWKMLELLDGADNPHKRRIACNIIWRDRRIWIVPRALRQTDFAARYFGGLEMGGIFCLPNADEFRRYLPDALRAEITRATLAAEAETRRWFEEQACRLLCEPT